MSLAEEMPIAVKDQLSVLVDAVHEYAIFMLDPVDTVVTWNSGARRIKGYEAGKTIGRHFSIFYTPDDITAGKPQFELTAAATDGSFHNEGWRVRKDRSQFWADVEITAITNLNGQPEGFAKVTRDDTARRDGRLRQRQVELINERDRVAVGLCDTIVRRVYACGLTLQTALRLSSQPEVATRIAGAIDQLDATRNAIRSLANDIGSSD